MDSYLFSFLAPGSITACLQTTSTYTYGCLPPALICDTWKKGPVSDAVFIPAPRD